jgi:transposase
LPLTIRSEGLHRAGVGEHLPAAQITFDLFHTVALLSKALDEVRRAEVKAEPGALKGARYLWLKRPEHLTEAQKTELAYLKVLHATLATVRAYRLAAGLRGLLRCS